MSGDILLMLDKLIPELLLQVDAPVTSLRQAVDGVEGRGYGAFFLVAADVDVAR